MKLIDLFEDDNTFDIVDTHTKQIIGTYKNRLTASRKADKKDLEYGAVRYIVRRTPPKATQ